MHHQLPDRKRTLNLLLRKASGSGKVCVLGQIEPQTPRLVVSFRQYLQVSILNHTPPRTRSLTVSLEMRTSSPASEMVSFKA